MRESVHPGNDRFQSGDQMDRPPAGGQGQGSGQASRDGEGIDDFVFTLTRDEFLDIFFDELALPNLIKRQLARIDEYKRVRAGYTQSGVPTNINLVRTMRGAAGRRVAVGGPYATRLRALRAELEAALDDMPTDEAEVERRSADRLSEIRHEAIPFIDPFDLRYSNRIRVPEPSTQAVMFCLMDVSGSMDGQETDGQALFHASLSVPNRITSISRSSSSAPHGGRGGRRGRLLPFPGDRGTIVSSALHLMHQIINERYASNLWNITAPRLPTATTGMTTRRAAANSSPSPSCPRSSTSPISKSPTANRKTFGRSTNNWPRPTPGFLPCSGSRRPATSIRSSANCSGSAWYDEERSRLIAEGSDWTLEAIVRYDEEIGRVAKHYGLDTYRHQLEVITAEQMMDAYAAIGMPVYYHHWSFGKHFLETENRYKRGQMGLAYEIVINSDPCIAYLMEENTLTMQALVIAHAAYGHNSFFKGNQHVQAVTSADAIIDYLVFARNYIAECEERHGVDTVEQLIDACHALSNLGVDRYKRSPPLSLEKEKTRQREREAYLQAQVNDLWRTLPRHEAPFAEAVERRFPEEPEENLLYFVEKNAPLLEPWQREIVRITRKIGQYFYPQRQTQVMMKAGPASGTTLAQYAVRQGKVNDGFMFEFLQSHTNVVYQPPYTSKWYSGLNPTPGLRHVAGHPPHLRAADDEDREWFRISPARLAADLRFCDAQLQGRKLHRQYLSPRLMREFRLFSVLDNDRAK